MGHENTIPSIACKTTSLLARSYSLPSDEELTAGYELAPHEHKRGRSEKQQQKILHRTTLKKQRRRVSNRSLRPEKIIAHFAYPAESRPSTLSHSSLPQPIEPTVTSTYGLKSLPRPLSMFTRSLSRVSNYITDCVSSSFSLIRATIFESSDAHINERKTCLREDGCEKVVRVIASVADGKEEIGGTRPIEMKARHKRVREIMRASGWQVEEELYEVEIRQALRSLRP